MKNKNMPVVSIVGRPNVGKSSLFNRLTGRRHAVVEEREGTTRDRVERIVKVKDRNFILVDTGGFVPRPKDGISILVKAQVEKAIAESDVVLFVCDGKSGLLPLDLELGSMLRKSGKKVMLVVNKIDNEKREENLFDFYRLGLGEPIGVSCLHNLGFEGLFDSLLKATPPRSRGETEKRRPIKIAIAGRPNVGKSSFLNRVLDEERAIVHDAPGTTRDSIDTFFEKDGVAFLLIDTAGLKHRRKVKAAVDIYSMMRTKRAIERADIVFFLLDGTEGVTRDDVKIFGLVREKGKGCVIVVNKWDLVKDIETQAYERAILKKIPEARNFPVLFASAKTGRNVQSAFDLAGEIKSNLDIFIDSESLSDFLREIAPEGVKISRRRKRPAFYSMAQVKTFPKEFLVFVNDPGAATDFHTAFIENRLRESFPLKGVPVRIGYRKAPRRKRQEGRVC